MNDKAQQRIKQMRSDQLQNFLRPTIFCTAMENRHIKLQRIADTPKQYEIFKLLKVLARNLLH